MTSGVDILLADEEDFPTLARIQPIAMGVDLLHRIMFESEPLDNTLYEQFTMAELCRVSSNPKAHILKAIIKSTGEIVGYGLVRFDDGKGGAGPSMSSFPAGTNTSFIQRLADGFRERHSGHMAGKPHASMSRIIFSRPHIRL